MTRGKISRDKAREGVGVRHGGGDHGRGRTKRDTEVWLWVRVRGGLADQ